MRAWRAYQLHDCCRIGIGWTTDAFRCLLFLFLYRKSPSLAGFTQSACRQKSLAYKRQVYLHDDCDLIFVASLSFAMILDWSFAEYVRICEQAHRPETPAVITVAESITRPVTPFAAPLIQTVKSNSANQSRKGRMVGRPQTFLWMRHTVCYRAVVISLYDYCI